MNPQEANVDEVIARELYESTLGSSSFIDDSLVKFTGRATKFFVAPFATLHLLGHDGYSFARSYRTNPPAKSEVISMFERLKADAESKELDQFTHELVTLSLKTITELPWPAMAIMGESTTGDYELYKPRYAQSKGLEGLLRLLENIGSRHGLLIALTELFQNLPRIYSRIYANTASPYESSENLYNMEHEERINNLSCFLMEIISESQFTRESFEVFTESAYALVGEIRDDASEQPARVLSIFLNLLRDEMEIQSALLEMNYDE